jgi:hypothetical protein
MIHNTLEFSIGAKGLRTTWEKQNQAEDLCKVDGLLDVGHKAPGFFQAGETVMAFLIPYGKRGMGDFFSQIAFMWT